MKSTFTLLVASLLLVLCSSSADDTKAVSAVIEINGMPASEVLKLIYPKLCGHELIVDSRAKAVSSPITVHASSAPPPTKEEVVKRFREAFLKQAGIVITPLDDKRESVTYNDALPITK